MSLLWTEQKTEGMLHHSLGSGDKDLSVYQEGRERPQRQIPHVVLVQEQTRRLDGALFRADRRVQRCNKTVMTTVC